MRWVLILVGVETHFQLVAACCLVEWTVVKWKKETRGSQVVVSCRVYVNNDSGSSWDYMKIFLEAFEWDERAQLWTVEGYRGKKWGKITQFSIQESTQRRRRLVCRQAKWVCEVDGLCCWECVAEKRRKKGFFAAGRKKCVESREIAVNERAYLIFFTHKIWERGERRWNDDEVKKKSWMMAMWMKEFERHETWLDVYFMWCDLFFTFFRDDSRWRFVGQSCWISVIHIVYGGIAVSHLIRFQ